MFKFFFSSKHTSYKQNLVDFATIEFPQKPQIKTSTKGVTQIGFTDNTNFYIVDIEDLSNYGLDIRPDELDDLYKGIIIGFFENPDSQPLLQKKFDLQGLRGLEIIYSSKYNGAPNLRYKRLLFFNGKIFSYEFWTTISNDEKSQPARDKFFNSFTVTLDKLVLKQYTVS